MQAYDRYKDSGVEWLGEIPEHWEVKRIKNFTNVYNGATPSSSNPKYWDGEIIWVTPKDISEGKYIEDSERKITQMGYQSCGAELVPKDSIIITTRAPIGKIGISTKDMCTNQGCKSLGQSNAFNTDFIYYFLFVSSAKLNSLGTGTTFMELSTVKLKDFIVSFPPLPAQQAIATFLDGKCRKIDEAVQIKQQQIEKLKELRQITIHNAVTKGVKPNTETNDSGIDWIGEIPKHWEVVPLKLITSRIVDGTHFTPKYIDYGIPFLRVTDLSRSGFDREIDWSNTKYISLKEHKELIKRANAEKGDILLSKNGTIGLTRVIDWDQEFSFFVSLCLIKPTARLSPFYFEFFFNCPIVDRQINDGSSRTSVTNLHLEKIKELLVILPPLIEQEDIVAHLSKQTFKIDAAIARKTEQIAKLNEYKQSLINEVVTGKVKVTD